MALENLVAKGAGPYDVRASHGLGADVKGWSRTLEASAAANINSTYDMGYIPTNARIMGLSRFSFDAVGGAGILADIGLIAVDNNMAANDPDALNDSIAANAAGGAQVIKDVANYGKPAWQFVLPALTSDPGGMFLVRITTRGAAGTGGTLTLEMAFTVP